MKTIDIKSIVTFFIDFLALSGDFPVMDKQDRPTIDSTNPHFEQ